MVANNEMYYVEGIPKSVFNFRIKDCDVPILDFRENGDILYKGRIITNDNELVDGLHEWLQITQENN